MAEKDKNYEAFRSKWKSKLGLKDRYVAEGYMRAHDPEWNAKPPEALERVPGNIDLHIIYGKANLSLSFPPECIEEMLEEWRLQIADQSKSGKDFTKKVIREKIGLNEHRGETAELLACGAIWFLLDGTDGDAAEILKQGDVEVIYEITDDDVAKATRTRVGFGESFK